MPLRMYRTSPRAAAVIASLGILTISLFVLRPSARHVRLSTLLATFGGNAFSTIGSASRISGAVVDASEHTPIPSATIVVTGTAIGANTTDDGTFTIQVPPRAQTITVRRIGYRAETIALEPGKTEYTVALQKDVLRLEAQVVSGVATAVSTPSAARAFPIAAAPFAPAAGPREAGLQVNDVAISDDAISSAVDASRMIVRSGGASIEVSSIDSAIPRVRELATSIGGFIANSSVEAGHDQVKTATLEVKAPAADFDRLISGLRPLGKVEAVNISAEDVGEEYVDIDARVANDHRLEARLIELLATRTGKLRDVLDVEQHLAQVREEIERYEGRLRFLRSHAELSTLTITVHEPEPIIIDHVGTNPLTNAVRQAWRNFIALLAFAIASLGILLPVAAIGGALWWFFRPATVVVPR